MSYVRLGRRIGFAAAILGLLGLAGCVAYPAGGTYAYGYGYPAYGYGYGYPAYGYAAPAVAGTVVIGGGWHGGWHR